MIRTFKRNLPQQLETQRLLLRLPQPADVEALHAAIELSRPELEPWMPWAAQQTRLETDEFCRKARLRHAAAEGLDVIMVEKTSGEIIGAGGYPRLDWELPKFEIGYWCRSDRAGRGLVSEMTAMLALYAFEQLAAARVELFIDAENVRSIAVAERLGFRLEGLLRCDSRNSRGQLRNMSVYAVVASSELSPPQPR